MNKLSFLTRFLFYVMSNPKKGKQMFDTKYQNWKDAKTNTVFKYEAIKSNLDQIIKILFPETNLSITEINKNTEQLQNHINNFFDTLKSEKYPSKKKPYPTEYTLDNKSGLFLYALCKLTQPEKIVETGVAYGLISMYILQALHENKKGTLYSIDSVFSPWQSKEMIGAAIPSHLRERWKLNSGSSSEKLSGILSSLKSVDVFFHDSLHTYKNMTFEFETSWPFINKNGFLISDDIGDNNAFHEFSTKTKLEPLILQQKENSFLGIIKKS